MREMKFIHFVPKLETIPEERALGSPEPVEPAETLEVPEDLLDMITRDNPFSNSVDQRHHNLLQVMSFHPTYLNAFIATQNFLLYDSGPLPRNIRHYIAIIAAARHGCMYLVQQHTREYIKHDGNLAWLDNLDNVPVKFRLLQDLNKILAHRPWCLNSALISSTVRSQGTVHWSIGELMHALVLMAHIHSLCSGVQGCGVSEELDDVTGDPEGNDGTFINIEMTKRERMSQHLVARLKKVCPTSVMAKGEDQSFCEGSVTPSVPEADQFPLDSEKYFTELQRQAARLVPRSGSRMKSSLSNMVISPDFEFVDFLECREKDPSLSNHHANDFGWLDFGYSTANRYYPNSGDLLDKKFEIARSFTYNTLGNKKDIDTERFRGAVWNFTHLLFGICHEEYDYEGLSKIINEDLMAFIKGLVFFPDRVTREVFTATLDGFNYSEKVHVVILIMEAKMQAELLYGLNALNAHMNSERYNPSA